MDSDAHDKSFKERESELLSELSALYTKLNQVREKRAKAEQEDSSNSDPNGGTGSDADAQRRRRPRVVLVTRTLPFTLIADEDKSQWRAEFPENVSLDAAIETYLCLHETHDCVWIGSVHGEIEPSEQNTLKEQLLQDRNYFPVFLDPKREKLFYQGFCKTVMWPLFHSIPPTTEDQLTQQEMDSSDYGTGLGAGSDDWNMEKMWQAYVAVNQAFADAVQEVYEEGDLIWIQGYHLTLVPQMVQSLFPNDNIHIGYFMHIPFPSSELYRILNTRDEILTGMLGADLIGFQTYEYARHFQSSAVRLLGLESSHKGVDFNGHFARVTICPVGIDAEKFITLARSEAVNDQIRQLKHQFAGKKVMLGVDQLDPTKGIVHKLLAVDELFTMKPELAQEVVFVQIVTGAANQFDSPLGAQVESLVSRINSKLQDIGADAPVQYLNQEIAVETLIALYALADALVVTPVRDGMNTIPFEYVVCREAVGRHARVVLSEFAGCAHSLGGAVLVNPWNTEELQDALLASLEDCEEVMLRAHQTMYSYVSTFTSRHWADNFLEQLEECSDENALAVSGRELSRRDMTSAYLRSSKRLLFINYEGVLAAEASIPELSYPPQELLWQLSMLTKDPRNTVVIVSARSMAVCEQWFAGLSGRIVLAAEYGVYVKWMGGDHESWRCMVSNMDTSWWEHVVPLLEYYTERTPGAFIERKDSSVAWHYRDCDLDHGLWQASELLISLREITRSLPVAVVPGNRYLEVRPQKVSKASLFERIWEFMNYATLFPEEELVVGTEYFGEPVLAPLASPLIKPQRSGSICIPITSITTTTGTEEITEAEDKHSFAAFRLKDPTEEEREEDMDEEQSSGGSKKDGRRSHGGGGGGGGGDGGGEAAEADKEDEEEEEIKHRRQRQHSADDDASHFLDDDDTKVDFVLVIASGDDRTDEDLFAVLVPPPIDLEAYCRQLEKDQLLVDARLSESTLRLLQREEAEYGATQVGSSSLEGEELVLMRRRSWMNGGGATGGEEETTPLYGGGTEEESGVGVAAALETRRSFRRLLHRDSSSSLLAGKSLDDQELLDQHQYNHHHHHLAPPLARLPSQGAEADFLLLGENITKLTPLYSHASLSKPSISEDAATRFPRALLTTPATARRDEITEKSKFTPRRDFPPSAALFKAMKTKYGDNFGMHRLPDTPAACWALVIPPTARAKLEDQLLLTTSGTTTSLLDRKGSTGTTTTIKELAEMAEEEELGVESSSTVDGGDEEGLLRLEEALARARRRGEAGGAGALEEEEEYKEDEEDEFSEDGRYIFPVNTFVCTLGRKLSQAPYFIKNSADLFQLLQEMGLSSHLRRQRQLSMSAAGAGYDHEAGSPVEDDYEEEEEEEEEVEGEYEDEEEEGYDEEEEVEEEEGGEEGEYEEM